MGRKTVEREEVKNKEVLQRVCHGFEEQEV